MKKIILPFFILLICCGIAFATTKHFWRGETMSTKTASKKWGTEAFDAQKFKSSRSERSKMIVSIINSKVLIGKSRVEIRELLGSHDGYYFTDMYPAYILTDESKIGGDTWQMVCLLNRDYKVTDVIIHKNCCDR